MSSRSRFHCMDCSVDTGRIFEHYFLINEVWALVHDSHLGMRCVGCCETRLGRQLVPEDFADVFINNPSRNNMSMLLLSRITGAKAKKG